MENSVFDIAVKQYGKTKSKKYYDKAAEALIGAMKQNEKVYVPMKKSRTTEKYIPCIVKDSEGILLCIAGTNRKSVDEIKSDRIDCLPLDRLINMCGELSVIKGISFNIWDSGFTVSKEMLAFIIEKRLG